MAERSCVGIRPKKEIGGERAPRCFRRSACIVVLRFLHLLSTTTRMVREPVTVVSTAEIRDAPMSRVERASNTSSCIGHRTRRHSELRASGPPVLSLDQVLLRKARSSFFLLSPTCIGGRRLKTVGSPPKLHNGRPKSGGVQVRDLRRVPTTGHAAL